MIQLYIDGKPAVPDNNVAIKLTSENGFFTKSASYTYDVELPLAIAENREIFGPVNRMDVTKRSRSFDALLMVDNVTVLAGTAHITSVTERAVKVQLLGSAASYNYGNKMETTFIDELDLGDWYMTTWPDGSYWKLRPGASGTGGWAYYPPGTRFRGNTAILAQRAIYNDNGEWSSKILLENLFSGKYPWVAYPVINSTADFFCNRYCYQFTTRDNKEVEFKLRTYEGQRSGLRPVDEPVTQSFAVQPYVWVMVQKIAEATGLELDKNDNALYTDPFFRRIFIVNNNNYIECNKCLPHWSVNEWWTQIENTFGVVMTIDCASKKMSLSLRRDHYSRADTVEIDSVVDEFTTEIDDDTQTDISANNVGFADFENDPADLLSEFITGNAEIVKDFNSLAELSAWAREQGSTVMAGKKDTIFDCTDGRQFIYTEEKGLVEVNMFRPRIVRENNSDLDIELKFVPARFIEGECRLYPAPVAGSGSHGAMATEQSAIGSFPVTVLQAAGKADMRWYESGKESIDIENIINGEDDEETTTADDKSDIIYMAIADLQHNDVYNEQVKLSTGGTFSGSFKYPRPFLRERATCALDGQPVKEDAPCSLSLIRIDGQTNLANETLESNVAIGTTVRHCFKFVAERIPDVGAVFLIRNRRFVCEKVEADIASDGLRKLITGYFYEFDM